MRGVNKVLFGGNVGHDPEMRQTGDGTPVCNFNIYVTERSPKKSEGKEDNALRVKVVCFGRLAETCHQYVKKGDGVLVWGKYRATKWTGQDGELRTGFEVVADSVQFIISKRRSEGDDGYEPPAQDDDVPF